VSATSPNILFVLSDQERQRDWLPEGVELPNRQRLIDQGMEFTNYFTHSSPCSPSRASIVTGQYVPQHGVNENVIFDYHQPLDPAIPTYGSALRQQGYYSAYVGKWHLGYGPHPDLDAHGFSDWSGNDLHFMGWAGTGAEFDPIIAQQAAGWLAENAERREPWCLTVGLVNPHDVMWFPIDHADWQAAHPDQVELPKAILGYAAWKDDDPIPTYDRDYDRIHDQLPANFSDDLFTKPAVQRQWLYEQQHSLYGYLDPHGLRSKGPFVYQEIMKVPLYVKAAAGMGVAPAGSKTDALATHVDLASTLAVLGGADLDNDLPTFRGHDLGPVLADPSASVREAVLFAQDTAWYERCLPLRYAIRGVFDGTHKYARYYGVGGGTSPTTGPARAPKLFDVDAPFEDHDHELYDLAEDPHELVNLANDPGHRADAREWFGRLKELEAAEGL